MATTHRLSQRPPLRALAVAASLALIGVLLLLMSTLFGANLLLASGGVALAGLAVVLLAAALWLARSHALTITLDEAGYRIDGGGTSEQGSWSEVTRVTRSPDQITLVLRNGSLIQLRVPRAVGSELDALGNDVAARLDADRGYRT